MSNHLDFRRPLYRARLLGVAVLAAVVIGCGGTREGQSDVERGPLERARMMELGGNLEGAVREYGLIADRAAGTESGIAAVRRIAYLHAMMRNDSAALYWYRILKALPTSNRERELIQLQVTSLERIVLLTTRLAGGAEDADSLKGMVRHLTAANTMQGRQIRDLETQLKKVAEELRQLKEIDARVSGRKPKE